MHSLADNAQATVEGLQRDPEIWGKIRLCLDKSLRRRNYLRFVAACEAYAAEITLDQS
jgi:hypothetical protein